MFHKPRPSSVFRRRRVTQKRAPPCSNESNNRDWCGTVQYCTRVRQGLYCTYRCDTEVIPNGYRSDTVGFDVKMYAVIRVVFRRRDGHARPRSIESNERDWSPIPKCARLHRSARVCTEVLQSWSRIVSPRLSRNNNPPTKFKRFG